jgi:hypothetical protein
MKCKVSSACGGEFRMSLNVICFTKSEFTFVNLREVAQTWRDEILPTKGVFRVGNQGRVFAS